MVVIRVAKTNAVPQSLRTYQSFYLLAGGVPLAAPVVHVDVESWRFEQLGRRAAFVSMYQLSATDNTLAILGYGDAYKPANDHTKHTQLLQYLELPGNLEADLGRSHVTYQYAEVHAFPQAVAQDTQSSYCYANAAVKGMAGAALISLTHITEMQMRWSTFLQQLEVLLVPAERSCPTSALQIDADREADVPWGAVSATPHQ
jgi:hypothetical protein